MTRPPDPPRPFPDSQCWRCDARPRMIPGKNTVFILCPRWPIRYPPQPQRDCSLFAPLPPGEDGSAP